MKKIILTITITLLSHFIYAQNTFPSTGSAGILKQQHQLAHLPLDQQKWGCLGDEMQLLHNQKTN